MTDKRCVEGTCMCQVAREVLVKDLRWGDGPYPPQPVPRLAAALAAAQKRRRQ